MKKLNINFAREVHMPMKYNNVKIGRYFADFIIDGKILLELKVVPRFGYIHCRQVLEYLKQSKIKLGILVYFTRDGVKHRRILNPDV